MSEQFEGEAAFVTGGGTAICRATALALATEGAAVTIAGRTEANPAEPVALIAEARGVGRWCAT